MPGYETERDAWAGSAEMIRRCERDMDRPGADPTTVCKPIREGYLLDALATAGVEVGAYDQRIARWFADLPDGEVSCLVRWITEANRSPAGNELPAQKHLNLPAGQRAELAALAENGLTTTNRDSR